MIGRSYPSAKDISDFLRRRYLSLLLVRSIWTVLYELVSPFYSTFPVNFWSLMKNILFLAPNKLPHTWYLGMILGYYPQIPFISCGLNQFASRGWLTICIIPAIITIYEFVLPIINPVLLLTKHQRLDSRLFTGFSGGYFGTYLLFGYYLRQASINCSKWIKFLSFQCFFWLTVAFQVVVQHRGIQLLVWYNNGLLLISTVCLFDLLQTMNLVWSKLFRTLSRYSFGIYMVHMPVMRILNRKINDCVGNLSRSICLWGGTYLLSFLLVFLIGRIPILRTWLLYLR